ncbi:PREDICTED: uncharacterized protein LOC106784144 [Polistes canadensis]|uniref:uncharacterized protein LOC106784144 n=1 Tax=Polistes canadensis TaxID=91411 RepID=UPI000718C5AE|nr:PREDICTED: uncharacterized protein LOC106784144 [Polistes canadensis]
MDFGEIYALFLLLLSFLVSITFLMAKDVYKPTLKESPTKKTKNKLMYFEDDTIDEKEVKDEAIFRYLNPHCSHNLSEYKALLMECYITESMTKEQRKAVERKVDAIAENYKLYP